MLSLGAYLLMLAAVAGLLIGGMLLGRSVPVIVVQAGALALMLWARLTLGVRSFSVDARPSARGLVTSGPYRWIRHPIYAAISLFVAAGVAGHWSGPAALLGSLAVVGAVTRAACEELLLNQQYPEYAAYARTTSRMIPGVF